MSSITKKFKKAKKLDIHMSMRFSCKLCGFQRLIPQSEFLKMKEFDFETNSLFFCDNCHVRMFPIAVEADF